MWFGGAMRRCQEVPFHSKFCVCGGEVMVAWEVEFSSLERGLNYVKV